jgi:hypothetical protein
MYFIDSGDVTKCVCQNNVVQMYIMDVPLLTSCRMSDACGPFHAKVMMQESTRFEPRKRAFWIVGLHSHGIAFVGCHTYPFAITIMALWTLWSRFQSAQSIRGVKLFRLIRAILKAFAPRNLDLQCSDFRHRISSRCCSNPTVITGDVERGRCEKI